MSFTVTIDGEQHKVEADNITPNGKEYGVITPDNIPDGFYTQQAMESKIKDRLKRAKDNAKDELKDDQQFHQEVLNNYNIVLDDDGNPKGLEPTVDIDEAKKQAAESVRKEYENKLEEKNKKLNQFMNKGLRSSIVDGANKIGIDGQYLEPLVEGGNPYLVKELEDKFAYNEEINDYALLDEDGESFKVDGNGFIPVGDFFEKNKDRFKNMLKDNRQRGSNFSGQGTPTNGTPRGNPAKWGRNKKLEYIAEHGRDGYKQAIDNYSKNKSDEE